MVALLDQHDTFIQFPTDPNSVDHRNAKAYASTVTYQQWQGGWLAADGSAIPLFQKPRYYGETFYDQKSRYSLNCQVCDFFFLGKNSMIILYFIIIGSCHAPQSTNCRLWTWPSR